MTARILIVDDVPANLSALSDTLEPEGYQILVARSGEQALETAARARPDLILLDVMMPGMNGYETCRRLKAGEATRGIPVIFLTVHDEVEKVVEGFRAGGVDYVGKPFQTEELLSRIQTHLKIHFLSAELERKNAQLQAEINERRRAEEEVRLLARREAGRWGVGAFVGQSAAIRGVIEEIRKLHAFTSVHVLITGESGTGKELVARAIHFEGPAARAPFVAVNCSAIPEELAESSFFGHVKGAFTHAVNDRAGYVEQADGGTLCLDEVPAGPLLSPERLQSGGAGVARAQGRRAAPGGALPRAPGHGDGDAPARTHRRGPGGPGRVRFSRERPRAEESD